MPEFLLSGGYAVAILIFISGLVFGSFMNVLIYRLPRGKNIATPPSSCPACGYTIKWYSNIPVISWVLQRGRCISCGWSIPFIYPLVELITGVVWLLIYFKFGFNTILIKYLIFSFILLGSAFTDYATSLDKDNFECGVIPDHYTIGGAVVGFIFALMNIDINFMQALAGSAAGIYILLIVNYFYAIFRKRDGIGLGDMFLMGMIGSFIGAESIPFILIFSSLIGAVAGILIVRATKNPYYMIPFGPMISFSALIYLLFSEDIGRYFVF